MSTLASLKKVKQWEREISSAILRIKQDALKFVLLYKRSRLPFESELPEF